LWELHTSQFRMLLFYLIQIVPETCEQCSNHQVEGHACISSFGLVDSGDIGKEKKKEKCYYIQLFSAGETVLPPFNRITRIET